MADSRPKVLVVDDEVKICELLQRLLSREGYDVRTAFDGAGGIAEILKTRPQLMITDLMMPGIDGLELLKRARSIDPSLAVVMITGYASMETAVAALREGVDDYVTKPFSIAELKTVVGRILENRALEAENRRLLGELTVANAQLRQHRERLTMKVIEAECDLSVANRTLEKRLGEMEILHEISQMTTTVLTEERLLPLVTKLIQDKIGVNAAAALMRGLEEDTLVAAGVRAGDRGLVDGSKVSAGEGLAGWVLANVEAALIPEAARDDRPSVRELLTFGEGSLLAVPITGTHGTLGVLMVSRSPLEPPLTSARRNLLQLIAKDLAVAIDNARLFAENERSYIDVLAALVTAMEARDRYLRQHSERVRWSAVAIARALGLPEQDRAVLDTGARLHDLGKVGIVDSILQKPGKLTDEEMAIMRSHPTIGYNIVDGLGRMREVKRIIRSHHERWDGGGYPDGLKGDEIPFLTQIVTAADAFDAMTSRRSYRDAMPREQAVRILREFAGTQFNPTIVEALIDIQSDRARENARRGLTEEAST